MGVSYAVHWKAGDIIIDPMASDGLRDAKWIAFRYVKHIDEIAYQGDLNTNGLEPNFRMEDAPDMPDGMEVDDFGLIEGYEIFAKGHIVGQNQKENLWIDICKDHDKFLRYDDEWPMTSLEDFPCEILSLADGVVDWHTKGPLIMGGADSMQSLVNEILDSYLSVIRKQKNLFLYDPRYIREEEIDAILEAEDMESFEVEGLVEAQGRAIQAIQFGDVPPEKGEYCASCSLCSTEPMALRNLSPCPSQTLPPKPISKTGAIPPEKMREQRSSPLIKCVRPVSSGS